MRGIPDISNYVSAWYPPIPVGEHGVSIEYLKLKKYSPLYHEDKQNALLYSRNKIINNTTADEIFKNKANQQLKMDWSSLKSLECQRSSSLAEWVYNKFILNKRTKVKYNLIYQI